MIEKLRWHTSYSKILRWTRWWNSFFDREPNSWPKNAICCQTSKNHFWRCRWINRIFWPWSRLSIEKRVAPACSAQNFTIGGIWAQKNYHILEVSRNVTSHSRHLTCQSRTPGNGGTAKAWNLQIVISIAHRNSAGGSGYAKATSKSDFSKLFHIRFES